MCTASFHPASSTNVPWKTLKVPSRKSCTSQKKNRAGLVQGPEHAVRKADPRRSACCEKAGGEEAEISTTDIHQLLQGFAWTGEDTT